MAATTIGYAAPEDVLNAALREVGYPRAIAEIYEGSRASRVAIEVYGPTRDALLQEQDWDFAYREVLLVASAGGALVAGFARTYTYPADCLRLRYVRGAIASPNNDPQPARWITYNDATLGTPAKVIGSNLAVATACYIAQVTDPATWNAAFSRALVNRLAKIFAFALRDEINLSRTRALMADQVTTEAADVSDAMGPAVPEINRGGGQARGQAQG